MYRQVQHLRRGVDVLIATPGRLLDLFRQGEATLDEVVVTVLDEADFMADLGFLPDVTELLDQTARHRPAAAVLGHARRRGRHAWSAATSRTRPGTRSSAPATPPRRPSTWPTAVAFRDKLPITEELAARPGRTLVFARTQLASTGSPRTCRPPASAPRPSTAACPQGARRRALEAFTDARSPVLVATDVAARGIHVDDVSLVLHYDPPTDAKTYLHRSGRTARAGAGGVVVSLLLPDQVGQAKRRFRQAKVDPDVDPDPPG